MTGEAKRAPRCPLCGAARDLRFRPFCSAHCRDKDLLAWLDGRYAVPAAEREPDDDDEPPPTSAPARSRSRSR